MVQLLGAGQPRDNYNQLHWYVVRQLFYTARHFIKVQVLTPKIADMASHLRVEHEQMQLPDAINIATAALEGCSVLYTFDGTGNRRRPHDLLSYNGIVLASGYPPLSIKVPEIPSNSQLPFWSPK